MAKQKKTLPELQEKLNYTGTDIAFKKMVLSALNNRGELYKKVFMMFYGINCRKYTIQEITEILPVTDAYRIKEMVMHRIEDEIIQMM